LTNPGLAATAQLAKVETELRQTVAAITGVTPANTTAAYLELASRGSGDRISD